MSQLDSLVSFIRENVPARLMIEFDNWMDDPKLEQSHRGYGEGQRRIGVLIYDGVVSWDRFPFKTFDPQIVFALILSWLAENSRPDEFTLDVPRIDLELIDDDVAILTITVSLIDEICLTEDDNGLIPFDGQKWKISSPVIWTAESADIFSVDSVGAPVTGLETS
ncbi:phage tail protein [Limnobaculum xujianqingii]|uniref:phage tail protein n=1 Tax=Limnobaculum xujianqingii TaxID=2738837 RepID=UPI001125E9B3|nr:phage tail protein [Limnobaculum xujianqingii]